MHVKTLKVSVFWGGAKFQSSQFNWLKSTDFRGAGIHLMSACMQSYSQNKGFDLLSFISTSTSRSDRSAQAKPLAMSSDSVSTSNELSPELRVGILHGYNSVCCSLVITSCNSDLLCTLQVRPKAVNKVCCQNMSVCAFTKIGILPVS